MSGRERNRLANQINGFVRANKPVVITISLAIGCRISNSLKFREQVNLPTQAWAHLAWFFSLVNEKVQRIYAPGLRVVIFDEATLFARLMGLSPQEVKQHLMATRKIIAAMNAPIEIVEMRPEMFPSEEVQAITVSVDNEIIYAIACSMLGMRRAEAMDPLYRTREKDFSTLREMMGLDLWDRARTIAEEVARCLQWRKRARLFDKLLGVSGIDACVTDKGERLVFDVTSNALLNHGMPVIRREQSGLYKAWIVPEYRIRESVVIDEKTRYTRPVCISPSEFGLKGPDYTFYYLVK